MKYTLVSIFAHSKSFTHVFFCPYMILNKFMQKETSFTEVILKDEQNYEKNHQSLMQFTRERAVNLLLHTGSGLKSR